MTTDWQFAVVCICVVIATWRIALRIWRAAGPSQKSGSCGSCHACPTGQSEPRQLVQLDVSPK